MNRDLSLWLKMSKEEEAIDTLQNCIADYVIGDYCVGKYCPQEDACKNDDCPFEKAIDTVINLIEKQEKVIHKMAKYINDTDFYTKRCEKCINNNINNNNERECIKCIENHFLRSVK